MIPIPHGRTRAMQVASKLTRSEAGRAYLESAGFTPGTIILPCDQEDLVYDVSQRFKDTGKPKALLVTAMESGLISMMVASNSSDGAEESLTTGGDSTIGQLIDWMQESGTRTVNLGVSKNVQIDEQVPATSRIPALVV